MAEISPPKVLANDFTLQWREIRDDAIAAFDRVGRSGWLVLGDEVACFESEVAEWWGMDHAVGVASGLDAIEIGLRCLDLPPGCRVATTPLTAFATTLAILRAGLEPVWCDVDGSGAVDLDLVDRAIAADESIRAFVPVHLYGHPLDPDRLAALAAKHGVAIVEDCAQSAGASRADRPTGSTGLAATSFYPTKNLGAMGDGGLLLSDDAAVAERARTLRDYGQAGRYRHVEPGLNSRLDEVQAAIMRSALLPRLDAAIARRGEIAARYLEALAGSPLRPIEPGGGTSAHHLFPVVATDREGDEALAALAAAGIVAGRHYPVLCPDQPAARTGVTFGELDNAAAIARREVSLPIHPYLSDEEVEAVVAACLALGE